MKETIKELVLAFSFLLLIIIFFASGIDFLTQKLSSGLVALLFAAIIPITFFIIYLKDGEIILSDDEAELIAKVVSLILFFAFFASAVMDMKSWKLSLWLPTGILSLYCGFSAFNKVESYNLGQKIKKFFSKPEDNDHIN